jgi:hypothetical protein
MVLCSLIPLVLIEAAKIIESPIIEDNSMTIKYEANKYLLTLLRIHVDSTVSFTVFDRTAA